MTNKIKEKINELSYLILKNAGTHRDYSDEDLSNVTIIFQEVFAAKMFDATKKIGFHKKAEYFEDAGTELKEYIRTHTKVDLHKVYETGDKSE